MYVDAHGSLHYEFITNKLQNHSNCNIYASFATYKTYLRLIFGTNKNNAANTLENI